MLHANKRLTNKWIPLLGNVDTFFCICFSSPFRFPTYQIHGVWGQKIIVFLDIHRKGTVLELTLTVVFAAVAKTISFFLVHLQFQFHGSVHIVLPTLFMKYCYQFELVSYCFCNNLLQVQSEHTSNVWVCFFLGRCCL